MNPSIESSVWAMPEPDLQRVSELVQRLLALRREFGHPASETHPPKEGTETPIALPMAPPSRAPSPQGAAHLARRPLRPPKAGSLRGDVHAILRQTRKPMSRADVTKRVATIRRCSVDDGLLNKVGEVLRNQHDNCIRKLAHGIYQYEQ